MSVCVLEVSKGKCMFKYLIKIRDIVPTDFVIDTVKTKPDLSKRQIDVDNSLWGNFKAQIRGWSQTSPDPNSREGQSKIFLEMIFGSLAVSHPISVKLIFLWGV